MFVQRAASQKQKQVLRSTYPMLASRPWGPKLLRSG